MITRWYSDDSIEGLLAATYAEGKSFLFQMFFGWREARKSEMKFVFSRKDWKNIDRKIEYYKKFVV